MTITNNDLWQMRRWGRDYARSMRLGTDARLGIEALVGASQYVAMAASRDERRTLTAEWEEGLRNSVEHMGEYLKGMRVLDDAQLAVRSAHGLD